MQLLYLSIGFCYSTKRVIRSTYPQERYSLDKEQMTSVYEEMTDDHVLTVSLDGFTQEGQSNSRKGDTPGILRTFRWR